ncbi:MAG: hypothetical protein U5K54_23120 [Cytophagales bacterium]|nr:hypothetical protein [Cytophagales bacterium]
MAITTPSWKDVLSGVSNDTSFELSISSSASGLHKCFTNDAQRSMRRISETIYQVLDFFLFLLALLKFFHLGFGSVTFDRNQIGVRTDALGEAGDFIRRAITSKQLYNIGMWKNLFNFFRV